jgi:hypothetical protein
MSEEIDVLNLLYFDETYLAPVRRRLRTPRTQRARVFALGEIVEAYFWLALGVEIGYYAGDMAELFAGSRFVEMLSESDELFRAYGFLFPPDFEIRLKTAQNQKQVIQKAVDYTFGHPEAFHLWFQRALNLEIEGLQDWRLTSLFAALALLAPSEIETLLLKAQPVENSDFFCRLGKSALIEAFGTSISHLESFAELGGLIQSSRASEEDRYVFRARIRQLTRWRLNFRNPNVGRYYPLLARRFFDARLGGEGLSLVEYEGTLDSLLGEWGLTHESSVSA